MAQDSPDLGEQALSKVAELGIASQLDEVEQIDVDIRTDPMQLMQGKVESVAIAGEGMVMQQDLRMESLEVNTGTVAINPLSAMVGKIELTQPAQADARIVLTEADLNRALSSDFLRDRMQNLQVQVNGQAQSIDTQHAQLNLQEAGNVTLMAEVLQRQTGEKQQITAIAVPKIQAQGQQIVLEVEEQTGASALQSALFAKVSELLDLRNFDMSGMTLTLKALEVQPGQLVLQAATQITDFPSA